MSDESIQPTVLGADGRPVSTGTADAPTGLPRRRRAWDVALSIFLLALTGLAGFFGALLAIVTFAVLGECVGECSIDGATSAIFLAGFASLLAIAGGVIGTVVNIVARRRGWWVALIALLLVIGIWITGFLLYGTAVGA